jgi:hypothetical protein
MAYQSAMDVIDRVADSSRIKNSTVAFPPLDQCKRYASISPKLAEGGHEMSSEPIVQTSAGLDPALLTEHPELAVLALDLPDSDGEPMENERESFQIDLLREALDEY